MTLLLLALALVQNPVVMVTHPRPPSRWNVSYGADCGHRRLLISGYAGYADKGSTPKVTFAGRPLSGPKVPQLLADLSTEGAAYRFSVRCERTGGVTLALYEGEAQRDGTVQYRSAQAWIRGGKLDYYSGLRPANAESFWFR